MKRVIVIGCPGSGKSTFSKTLHETTGLPLYHLDMMFWSADGTKVPRTVFDERLNQVFEKESWIIDGNYARTMELRMQHCDTVFFLDYPTEVCIEGVKSRKGKRRSDMPFIAREDDDEEFMKWIKDYNADCRPMVMDLLNKYSDRNIIIFNGRDEADLFLSQMLIKESKDEG